MRITELLNEQVIKNTGTYPANLTPQVKKIQTQLQRLGYDVGTTGIDGKYGPRTEKAVRRFQQDNSLKVDGIVGPETVNALTATKSRSPRGKLTNVQTQRQGGTQGSTTNTSNIGKGSAPATVRYNNPLAMYPANWQKKYGAIPNTDTIGGGHKIAGFPDAVSGAAAGLALLQRGKYYRNKPISDAIATWSGGNHVSSYIKSLEKYGIDTSKNINVLTPAEIIMLAKAMAHHETGKPFPLDDASWQSAYAKSKQIGLG